MNAQDAFNQQDYCPACGREYATATLADACPCPLNQEANRLRAERRKAHVKARKAQAAARTKRAFQGELEREQNAWDAAHGWGGIA